MINGLKTTKDFLKYIKSRRVVINGDSALETWHNKLSNLGSSEILDVVVIGDSISAGFQNAANLATLQANGFYWKLQDYFNTKYDNVGRGFITHNYPSVGAGPQIVTKTGTWTDDAYGPAKTGCFTRAVDSTLAFDFYGTGCEIWTWKNTSQGNIDVSIDGGEAVNFNLDVASTPQYPIRLTVASDLEDTSPTPHTALITMKSNTPDYFRFTGFMEHRGTRGVRFHMAMKSGAYANTHSDANALLYIAALNPDLVIYNIGTNDYMTSRDPATVKTEMKSVIDTVQALDSCVIIGTDGSNDRTGYTYPWSQYLTTFRDVALEEDCCFVDIDKLWGTKLNFRNNGYVPAASPTDIHPTRMGHESMFNVFKNAMEG